MMKICLISSTPSLMGLDTEALDPPPVICMSREDLMAEDIPLDTKPWVLAARFAFFFMCVVQKSWSATVGL